MKSIGLLSTALVGLLALGGFSPQLDDNPFGGGETSTKVSAPAKTSSISSRSAAELELESKLSRDIEFNYDETPFLEVMDELRAKLQINVLLDQSARDDSLSDDEPIRFSLGKMPASEALPLMLKERNAGILLDGSVLRIISLDVASDPEFFRRRMFDCGDLIRLIIQTEDLQDKLVPQDNISARLNRSRGGTTGGGLFQLQDPTTATAGGAESGGGGGSAGGGSETSSSAPEPVFNNLTAETQACIKLIDLVKAQCNPDGWDDTNGDGVVEMIGSVMVVSQSENTIQSVHRMLTDLEYHLQLEVDKK